ncbi:MULTISPECIES: chemotaxis protein CheW [Fervidobacterium]|uniref:Putative CheW protein n=1 Tax=Fervidobacterium nodosum (strain ATCC 35602 / DSM 5306 / Rt17-B1) TaxID=381764 RepID=A7HKW3_FERNB|nr:MULTISPECIES: chemotaxis protein CheW [Fervidobacterium]ABS60546.1 putative CheW protein [Fervidobacterium nodosum Rt17-B1]KAF2962492.1 chemotaxis protein CheW [Fervidobacterium sp. 2310opik-2]PHJ14103.1 chemotaxis protein CheW [Fervidobacterium sp. SC_NGM5_G05]
MEEIREFEVLVFKALNQEMAIDVEMVEIVIDKTDITPVPKARKIIEGVINLRGKIIPVISLPTLLAGSDSKENQKKIVIVKIEDVEFGLIVNEVVGVLRTNSSELETNLGKINTYGKKAKGLIKKGTRLIVYLNLEEILREITGSEVA